MDRLPQSLLDEIAKSLDGSTFPRSRLATISPQWRMAIEQQTFQTIVLKSSELDEFRVMFSLAHRRRCLKDIRYIVELPPYVESDRGRFEREEDRRVNNQAFTAALQQLLDVLKSWNPSIDGLINLRLSDAYSVTDHLEARLYPGPSAIVGRARIPGETLETGEVVQELDLERWRHAYSQLELWESELPTVPVIGYFTIGPYTSRKISPSVALNIVTKLPNVRQVDLHLWDLQMRYAAYRRLLRQQLNLAISNIIPTLPSLQSLVVDLVDLSVWSEEWNRPSLNADDATMDTLSRTLHTVTTNLASLKYFSVIGPIDQTLFSPPSSLEPYWQNLEQLHVEFSNRRPFGGGYFRLVGPRRRGIADPDPLVKFLENVMPPGHGYSVDEDETASANFTTQDHWSLTGLFESDILPNEEAVVPLLESFGRACAQMRALKSAHLLAQISGFFRPFKNSPIQGWGVTYLSPGASPGWHWQRCAVLHENKDQRRLFWTVEDWRPSLELQALFQSIGEEMHRGSLVEKFLAYDDLVQQN